MFVALRPFIETVLTGLPAGQPWLPWQFQLTNKSIVIVFSFRGNPRDVTKEPVRIFTGIDSEPNPAI